MINKVNTNKAKIDDELRNTFGRRLKMLRTGMRLTLYEFSAALELKSGIKISYGALCNYERSYRIPDLYTLTKIAEYFDVTTDYLLGIADDKNTKVFQTTVFDDKNEPRIVKIGVAKESELANMSIKDIKDLVAKFKNLGIDFNKIN